jgi:uncharacterized SAM-binding protein YcdF (DUF218 family)
MFILSKIVFFLLNPALWVLLALLVAWKTRNPYRRKRWLAAALFVFVFFSSPLVVHRFIKLHQWQPMPMKAGEKYEAGILLGGVLGYDENYKEAFFMGASDRFIQTLKLYKQGHIKKIIVSGGNAVFAKGDYREGDWLVTNLLAMGVPPEDILNERKAQNTVENARFSHHILDSMGSNSPVVIITSAWHMTRAVKIFEKEGVPVRPYPVDYMIVPSQKKIRWHHLVPTGSAMEQWNLLFKEWVGVLAIGLQRTKINTSSPVR